MNSSGTSKVFRPRDRGGVQGGALLDKSIHDFAITGALLAPNNPRALTAEITNAVPLCFLACKDRFSSGLLNGYNQVWSGENDAEDWPADGAAVVDTIWKAQGSATPARFHASWIGVASFDEICKDKKISGLGETMKRHDGCPNWKYSEGKPEGYTEEDARLLEIQGRLKGESVELLVNFLARGKSVTPWIWNNTRKSMIEVPRRAYGSNSLARVLEQGVLAAAGAKINCINGYASLLCHRELISAHEKMLESKVRVSFETKVGAKITGGMIDLSWQDPG